MAHRSGYAWSLMFLGTLAVPALFACSGNESSPSAGGRGARDASSTGGAAGKQSQEAGPTVSSGGALMTGSGGGAACNANRAPGIPINAGTMSANVDALTLSGSATILWAAGANTLSLDATDGSSLTVFFPGCEAKPYSIPGAGAALDPISITYMSSGGGEPQWACTYADTNPGPANCTVDVTAYGARRDAPVTGTFSGVMRLMSGTGASTKTVSAGTFTFGRP